jgi:CheY-like chemotaxis protein
MSHEIRTPMNAILGFSQLLLRDGGLSASQRESLGVIARSGEHLLSLLNDILEMSKIEAGRVELRTATFDLSAMVDDLAAIFRARAEAKRIAFAVERTADLPRHLLGDEGKLRQVLINLLGNAVKFTREGGVTLRLAAWRDATAIRLSVAVADTGVGIAAEELGHLFQPFEQTRSGREAHGGTGLGLAISHEHVRLLGGELTVVSEPGRGSTFRFEVPFRDGDPDALESARTGRRVVALASSSPRRRVLVVDDRAANRLLLVKLLSSVGFEVKEAADGALAVEAVETWRPHLVLLDMVMPVMDGYEAARRIKAGPCGAETAILALTASAFEEDRQAVLAAGADDFMRKPFQAEELFARIGARLGLTYRYEEEHAGAEAAAPVADGPAPEAVPLPPELVAAMRDAAVAADLDELSALVERAAAYDVALAARLRDRVARFDYEGLATALS